MKDYGEPWTHNPLDNDIRKRDREMVLDAADANMNDDYAARITACVNACKGINPKALPDFLKKIGWVLKDVFFKAPEQLTPTVMMDRFSMIILEMEKLKAE